MDWERRPIVAQVLDNLMLWLFVGAAIALLYSMWATVEIMNHYVGVLEPYSPTGQVSWR